MAGAFPSGERESVSSRVSILGENARRRVLSSFCERANDGATVRPRPAKSEPQEESWGAFNSGQMSLFPSKARTTSPSNTFKRAALKIAANKYLQVAQLISTSNQKQQTPRWTGRTCPRPRELPKRPGVANSENLYS